MTTHGKPVRAPVDARHDRGPDRAVSLRHGGQRVAVRRARAAEDVSTTRTGPRRSCRSSSSAPTSSSRPSRARCADSLPKGRVMLMANGLKLVRRARDLRWPEPLPGLRPRRRRRGGLLAGEVRHSVGAHQQGKPGESQQPDRVLDHRGDSRGRHCRRRAVGLERVGRTRHSDRVLRCRGRRKSAHSAPAARSSAQLRSR